MVNMLNLIRIFKKLILIITILGVYSCLSSQNKLLENLITITRRIKTPEFEDFRYHFYRQDLEDLIKKDLASGRLKKDKRELFKVVKKPIHFIAALTFPESLGYEEIEGAFVFWVSNSAKARAIESYYSVSVEVGSCIVFIPVSFGNPNEYSEEERISVLSHEFGHIIKDSDKNFFHDIEKENRN